MTDGPDPGAAGAEHAARLRLAEIAERRRQEINETRKHVLKVFPSYDTWRGFMRGARLSPRNYRVLEDELGWETGSVDGVLAGGEPRLRVESVPAEEAGFDAAAFMTETGELLAGIAVGTDEDRAFVLERIRAIRADLERLRRARSEAADR